MVKLKSGIKGMKDSLIFIRIQNYFLTGQTNNQLQNTIVESLVKNDGMNLNNQIDGIYRQIREYFKSIIGKLLIAEHEKVFSKI